MGPGTAWEHSEAKGVAGDHTTSLHQGAGDASEVTEQLLLVRVRLQSSHTLPDPGCSLGRGQEGFRLVSQTPYLPLVTLKLTSIHQLSQSIFSCWAVGRPSPRDFEALVGGKQEEKINWGCDPGPGSPLQLKSPILPPHLDRTTTMA